MDAPVPLPNVSSKILAKVIEYCKYHVDADKTGDDGAPAVKEEDAKAWDTEFVKVDQGTLFELILVRKQARKRNASLVPLTATFAALLALPCALTRRAVPQAANFLNIKSLLDLTCLTVANMIKGALRAQRRLRGAESLGARGAFLGLPAHVSGAPAAPRRVSCATAPDARAFATQRQALQAQCGARLGR
jgi:hypothetical protein